MPRNEFTLTKRIYPNKIKIFYYYAYDENGKRVKFSTGKHTKAEALQYCIDLAKKGKLIPKKKDKTNFKTFSENWFTDKCLYIKGKKQRGQTFSQSWAKENRSILERYILPQFENCKLSQIKALSVEKWLLELPEISNSTKNKILNTLKIMLSEAKRLGLIEINPAENVKPLHRQSKIRGILTTVEVKELFDRKNFIDCWKGNRLYYAANLLASCTGMRQGEILALRPSDIFPDKIVVSHSYERLEHLKSTKTGKIREIPISEFIRNILSSISHGLKQDDYIFSGDDKTKPLTPGCLTDSLYFALAKIKINRVERNITFHSWRHYFNTQLIASGIDKMIVQSITGHSTDQMTEHYLHLNAEHLKCVTNLQHNILNGIL